MSTADSEAFTLIHTKLHMPRTSGDFIPRPHLTQRLNQGLEVKDNTFDRKLTLISAPAGYGKTTLATSWLQSVDRPVAWVSLDESDNDLILFLQYLIAAIRTQFPTACEDVAQVFQGEYAPPLDNVTARLINDIVTIPEPFMLVMDDYHLIHDETVHKLLAGLIGKQPPNLHLVITTRGDPLLPLARLRAKGKMTEIRAPELRFQAGEAELVLHQLTGTTLDRPTIEALVARTEGWIVGLRLAAIFWRGKKDFASLLKESGGAPNTFVSEYLVSEVLDQQPEAIQDFLLKTSILDRLCGPLCEAVTGIDDPVNGGQAYLEGLEQANLFLISLDERQEWYRYHHLFRSLLARRLAAIHSAEEIKTLHRRASQWFAGQGQVEEALSHALVGDDMETAIKLVEDNSQNLLNRLERFTLERWLAMLPEEIIWQRPKLLLAQAWLLFRQWRISAMDAVLDRAEACLENNEKSLGSAERGAVSGQIKALRSVTTYLVNKDYERALTSGKEALGQLPASTRDAQAVALAFLSFSRQALGQRDEAVHQLSQVVEAPMPHGPAKIQAFIGLSFIHWQAGNLAQLHQSAKRFLAFAAENRQANALLGSNYNAGLLHYEWNNLKRAADHFSKVVELRYRSNFVGALNSALALARIYQVWGRLGKSQEMIDVIRQDTLKLQNSDLLPLVESAQARQWSLQGDEMTAKRWARAYRPETIHDNLLNFEFPSLTQAWILVMSGTKADVLGVRRHLQEKLTVALADNFKRRAIQILIHLALVHERLGDADEALAALDQAVRLAQPGGFIRSFLDGGPSLLPTLRRLPWVEDTGEYLAQVVAAFSETGRISASPAPPVLLTRREKEILILMESGLTNREIADKLVISLHTVKRHASNIYKKLAVKGREQAIYRAQVLGIFS